MAVRKPCLKDKESDRDQKKEKNREDGKERKDQDDEEVQIPERQIQFDGAHANTETNKKQKPAKNRQISTRRIWDKKGFSTSKVLYYMKLQPHHTEWKKKQEEYHKPPELSSKHNVDQETRAPLQQMYRLSIEMKQDLETLQSRGPSSSEQILSQQEALTQQISKLTDVARRHDDEIDNMRAMQETTCRNLSWKESRERANTR